ncbi:MAG TPA: hypothetical protein VF828_02075, partial [Patescibacteria group bacterium]
LLVHNCQKRVATKASYWYLERGTELQEKKLPDLETSHTAVLKYAKQIKLARQLQHFKCPTNGCRCCQPFEEIIKGDAEFVGTDDYKYDVYIQKKNSTVPQEDSIIL